MLAGADAATNQGHEASPAGDPFAACSIGQDVFGGVNYADYYYIEALSRCAPTFL